eukprot:808093-Pelagomonas_calceolata.AAC.2
MLLSYSYAGCQGPDLKIKRGNSHSFMKRLTVLSLLLSCHHSPELRRKKGASCMLSEPGSV